MSHKHIYIRHGNDIRTSRKHDERLSDQGKRSVKYKVNQLVEEYGLPDLILYSPFYRCRQTAKIMKKTLSKYHNFHLNLQNLYIYLNILEKNFQIHLYHLQIYNSYHICL